jgi:DNA-binding winged helix-turn-helix (wHTH) protein/tetratricopeptide (TPR) repeat protein
MLKLTDLAGRPDFTLGPLRVSPSRRLIEGPAGSAHLQPIVMKVFLLLLDAQGNVVTRDELFDSAWGGVFVGDDSLNRAITGVRKIASETAPGLFEIEAIPRTGYRLTGEILQQLGGDSTETRLEARRVSRRALIGGGVAATVVVGAAGFWWTNRSQPDPRFDVLMQQGKDALRVDQPSSGYFEQAIALEPRNAQAWGLLAFSRTGANGDGAQTVTGKMALEAERAARTALSITPNEPNALLTMTMLQTEIIDRLEREDRYRRVLAIDPENVFAMRGLGQLLHGVGRCRESLAVVERALAIEPLVPNLQFGKAMELWVLGRVADADRVINRAMQLWPSHRLVRLARLMIYAFTGRAHAALAIVEEEAAKPILLTPVTIAYWRASLRALQNPTPAAIAAARKASIEAARPTSAAASWAILVLSALGELDAAFDVAEGFLLGRGSVIVQVRADTSSKTPPVHGPGWRNTFGLFIPPTKAMRLDPRFKPLADGLGLTDYWRSRGIGPDSFLFKA